jgi:hypothetical protein
MQYFVRSLLPWSPCPSPTPARVVLHHREIDALNRERKLQQQRAGGELHTLEDRCATAGWQRCVPGLLAHE